MDTSNHTTKCCTGECGQTLPATAEYFYSDKRATDGLYSCCKPCFLERAKKSRHKDIEKTRARELASYYRHHEARLEGNRRYRAANPEKEHARHQRYYLQNRARVKAYQRNNLHLWRKNTSNWKKRHPDRSRMLSRIRAHRRRDLISQSKEHYSPEDVDVQFRSQKGLCWWCSNPLDLEKFHIDHRIPLSKGGSDSIRNICCTCEACNLSKSNKMSWEWTGRLL